MFLFLVLFLLSDTNAHLDSLIIQINSGLIEGQYVHSKIINKSYYSFRGIPYAEPPVGKLRFLPPVEPNPWNHVLETKADGPQCMQMVGGSEDCLFLNVYTPNLPCNEGSNELLPVMVYIHGGGLILGSSNSNEYGPEYLIDKNIVLVAMNYRLNIFGFLNAMEETAPGNVGLKDQVAALQWVQKNIEKFNGDPRRVTLFGHSGGSAAVNYHLQSKFSKGLFQNAIMQSGCTLNKWSFERNPLEVLHKLGNILNIDSKSMTEFVNKLRNLSSTELYNAAVHPDLLDFQQTIIRVRFIPSVEYNSPDAFISENSYPLLVRNEIHDIPLLIGHVSNEAAVLFDPVIQEIFNFTFSFYKNNLSIIIPKSLNIVNDSNTEKAVLEEIKNQYFNNDSVSWNLSFVNYLNDEGMIRGIRKIIDFLRKDNDIYYYIFDYKEDNIATEYNGVPHIGELKYLFYSGDQQSAVNKRKIDEMTTLWTNFAKTGNPTPTDDSMLGNIKWPMIPKSKKEKINYLSIGENLEIKEDCWQEINKFWERIFHEYGKKPFVIY